MEVFNLIDEPWIPVIYHDGRCAKVGIQQALKEAGSIRQVAAPNPMDRVAVLRFLLAVLYWCEGNPPEQSEKDRILASEGFPVSYFSKLQLYKQSFNLLGDGRRFYQDPLACRKRAVTDLLQEIPTGNNFWHFRHSTDGKEGLCISCCAMGLLRLPMFSTSGLPDLKAGINGTPPIYVIPVGRCLLYTLLLNWIHRDQIGFPAWEESGVALIKGEPVPLLNGLTRLSRRVWLHEPILDGGLCIGCGRQSALIQYCEYQSAGLQYSKDWNDPHIVYVKREKQGEPMDRKPLLTPDLTKSSFQMDKPWSPLFIEIDLSTKYCCHQAPIYLLIVGFATDKAKNIDVWERICVIPPILPNQNIMAVKLIAIWNSEGKKLAVRLKPENSDSRSLEFVAAITSIRPHVESQVSDWVGELLTNPAQSWPRAIEEYRQYMAMIATSLVPGFTVKALNRRGEICRTLPDMALPPDTASCKSKRKEVDQ